MITSFLTRIFTSRPFKLLAVLAVLIVVTSQLAPRMIDTKAYVERIGASIRETTGATMVIKGGVQLTLLPRPALVLEAVEITQPDTPYAPTLGAGTVELALDIPSLLSGTPNIGQVRVDDAVLIVEKLPTGQPDWGFIGAPFLKAMASLKPSIPVAIEISRGRVSLADAQQGKTEGIVGLRLSGTFGENSAAFGSFTYNDTPLSFSVARTGAIGATPITLDVASAAGHALSLKGSMDFTASHPIITAKLEAKSPDISGFLGVAEAEKTAAPTSADAPDGVIPLTLAGDYVQKEGIIRLSDIALESLGSSASGSVERVTGKTSRYVLSLDFKTLDLTSARRLAAMYIVSVNRNGDDGQPKTLASKAVEMSVNITADKMLHGAQTWSRAIFNGTVSDGMLTVNQLTLSMPGESKIALFGLLSISDTQGLRFEGNTEAKGTSLRDLLTIFDESASNLPALGFGAYELKSNLFISKELMRLSEASAQFSELTLKGGLVTYFDQKPRIEADVLLRDINFDYFRDSWRSNTSPDQGDGAFLRFDRGMNFDWLKKLSAVIDFRVQAQGFTFLERKGSDASFRLFAQGGEFGIYNAKFVYDTDTTEGSLKFDVTGETPSINLVMNAAVVNTGYFSVVPAPPEPVPTAPPSVPPTEELPDMVMPSATPEEELREKIAEEAASIAREEETKPTPGVPAPEAEELSNYYEEDGSQEESSPVELTPLATPLLGQPEVDGTETVITTTPQSLLISDASAQDGAAPAELPKPRWSEALIDMSMLDGVSGNFDISIGKLQHKGRLFENFKMMAKLERNLFTFQTLTFSHWGGSFSINGTLFGGKVPGISMGFIVASADIDQILGTLIGMHGIGGRASISGTLDTSGVNFLSWVSQANAKLLFAGRGVTIRGFDAASVVGAVQASRTAADVFNNVNLSIAGGIGEYSADGSINLNKGVISTPGIALKTGRVIGSVSGDFRLIPWDVNISGTFKFPELTNENVPTLTARWAGPVENISLQTDTQSLEAFVSKRITGN